MRYLVAITTTTIIGLASWFFYNSFVKETAKKNVTMPDTIGDDDDDCSSCQDYEECDENLEINQDIEFEYEK